MGRVTRKDYPDYAAVHGRIRARDPRSDEQRPTDDIVVALSGRPVWAWLARTPGSSTQSRLKGYVMEADAGRLPKMHRVEVTFAGIGPDDLEVAALMAAGQVAGLNLFFGRAGGEGATAQRTADRVDAIMALIANQGRGQVEVKRTAEGIRTPIAMRKRYGLAGSEVAGHRARSNGTVQVGDAMDILKGMKIAARMMRRMEMAGMDVPAFPDIDYAGAETALAAVDHAYPSMVEWYGGKGASGTQGNDRLQAAASYPLLAGMIARKPALRAKVDNRQPIREDILEITGLSEAGLKRLAKFRTPVEEGPVISRIEEAGGTDAVGVTRTTSFLVDGRYSIEDALTSLRAIKPEWVPQDDEEWKIFLKVCRGFARPMADFLGIPEADILARSKGRWGEFLKEIAAASDVKIEIDKHEEQMPLKRLLFFTSDAMQSVWDFARDALIPTVLVESDRHNLARHAWSGIYASPRESTFDEILSVSRTILLGRSKNPSFDLLRLGRTHSTRLFKIAAIWGKDDKKPDTNETETSGIAAPPVQRFISGKITMKHLETFTDMQREGEDMGHCVGRDFQLSSAHEARNIYYSMRGEDGSRSTARFTVSTRDIPSSTSFKVYSSVVDEETGVRISLVEHKGVENTSPPATHAHVVQEMLQSITPEKIAEYAGAWVHWRKNVADSVDILERDGARNGRSAMPWARLAGLPIEALDIDLDDIQKRKLKPERASAVWKEWAEHVLPKPFAGTEATILARIPAFESVVRQVLLPDRAEALLRAIAPAPEPREADAEDAPAP